MRLDLVSLVGTHLPRRAAPLFSDLRWRGPERRERVAYLTFDDGPSAETPHLLDVLARHQAKATFFVLGEQAQRFPEHTRAVVEAGHVIGNHTFAHPDPWLASRERVLGELDRTTDLLESQIGERVPLARPPYGHVTPSMRRWAQRESREVVMWDLMPGDFLPWATARNVVDRVLQLIRPGSVIVLHDQERLRTVTRPALRMMLRRLADAGWRFEALR